ncbi:glycosyltransferase [Phenylobacterium sp.]|uniref:glycosyltransferase n=1 Tax=Phenylobacterium sp. TaxID=1871053 RepID=UPI00286C920F|nr:glycosyltransferase [Phenylobacterium sp.]
MTKPTAVVVSFNPAFQVRAGNSEYLASFTRSLAGAGFDANILILEEIPAYMARIAAIGEYTGLFSQFQIFRAVKVGRYFYSLNPRHWLNMFLRVSRLNTAAGRSTTTRLGFDCYVPHAKALSWARRKVALAKPTFVVANYFNSAPIFDQLPPGVATAILTHDILALRALSVDAAGVSADFDRGLIAQEAAALNKADVCFAIKTEEEETIREIAPDTQAVSMPMAVEIGEADLAGPRDPVCIFVGSDHPPNKQGLRWLLTEAWPRVLEKRPDARLHVVGSCAYSIDVPLPANVDVLGFVDNLADAYARAAVSLTPVLYGSGVKIKLVEALAAGLPSVATTVGAEGVPLASPGILRVADGAEIFACAVLETLADCNTPAHREAVRDFARLHYDRDTVGIRVIDRLIAEGLFQKATSDKRAPRTYRPVPIQSVGSHVAVASAS